MESLPQTDVELGSIVSLGYTTNGVRDAILYQQHLKPLIYTPLHMTDVAAISSSLEFKKSFLAAEDAAHVAYRPELRWMVDPDDFLKPMIYDPSDARWLRPGNAERVAKLCGDARAP